MSREQNGRRPGSPPNSDETLAHKDQHHTAVGPDVAETVAERDTERRHVREKTGKRELKEEDCESELGYAFSSKKKWWILTVIFLVQTSMNFNTSLYSNGLKGISEHFSVSEQGARVGAAIYLITYAFGCELWAPWSEEFGRKPILQASLFLTNIFALPVVLAPNFGSLLVGRALGGLSTAGGSVTLGMIADLYESDNQQYAVAYIVFSSVGGSILGPIVGGFVELLPPEQAWKYCIWIQFAFGGFVQLLHLLTVPETRTTVMMNQIAKKRRKTGQDPDIYGPDEIESFWDRFTFKELIYTWLRPFRMFLTEPIVLTLSLLSGFSDALIFVQIQSLTLVYAQYNFTSAELGLAFIPFAVGYAIAWALFIPAFKRNAKRRAAHPEDEHAQYESRMSLLLWLAPCLPIGLIIFAWTSLGPPIPWIAPMIGTAIIGIANYAIYMATIDYMVCAYGPYSASATGGNGWARDFLAGVLTVPATPFYTNIGAKQGRNLQYATTILFAISVVLVAAVYWVYWKGPELRKRSPFAQSLASNNVERERRRSSVAVDPVVGEKEHHGNTGINNNVFDSSSADEDVETARNSTMPVKAQRPAFGTDSRRSSYMSSERAASRRQSREIMRSRRNSRDGVHQNNDGADGGVQTVGRLHNRFNNLDTIASVQQTHSQSAE
ncbi:major facilitator superfamily domain-containing protein [Xylariaceae sp. FL0255]|nr:major facilitator superfamily domain-containing protein [Xylariaceae sp. FL0255]